MSDVSIYYYSSLFAMYFESKTLNASTPNTLTASTYWIIIDNHNERCVHNYYPIEGLSFSPFRIINKLTIVNRSAYHLPGISHVYELRPSAVIH